MMLRPTLLALGARSLYVGPAFGLSAHTNAVSLLACGLDGPFEVALGDTTLHGPVSRACRSAFIPAHTLVKLDCGTTTMAFLYVDAQGLDDSVLRTLFDIGPRSVAFDVPREGDLIDLLHRVAAGGAERRRCWEALLDLLHIHHERRGDERILRSLARLGAAPGEEHSLASVAAEAKLSESRYLHLFKQATGVPFRRYRQWIRIGAATRAIARGQSLTEAALAAGFASSSHFSFAFKEMFGMAPSGLARMGLRYGREADRLSPATPDTTSP